MTSLANVGAFTPVKGMSFDIRPLHDGIQVLFRFPNDAGVSVVRHSGSYGSHHGMWEAAPILFFSDSWDKWDFIGKAFDLPGFADRDDVRGWLSEIDVDEILNMVANL